MPSCMSANGALGCVGTWLRTNTCRVEEMGANTVTGDKTGLREGKSSSPWDEVL